MCCDIPDCIGFSYNNQGGKNGCLKKNIPGETYQITYNGYNGYYKKNSDDLSKSNSLISADSSDLSIGSTQSVFSNPNLSLTSKPTSTPTPSTPTASTPTPSTPTPSTPTPSTTSIPQTVNIPKPISNSPTNSRINQIKPNTESENLELTYFYNILFAIIILMVLIYITSNDEKN